MAQAAGKPKYVELFNNPSVEAMYALLPKEFEEFVAYVLRRAGYEVNEVGRRWRRGLDLEMRRPGRITIVGGVECKRLQSDDVVMAGVVAHVRGAAAVSRSGAKPYVITTSDFHENARQLAATGARPAYLMNGRQLVRYITYIRGSRYDDDDTLQLLSPEFFCGREQSLSPQGKRAKILTIANNKGGVGKTTTAYYLGAELARQGNRVLLIDLDGQGNLTERCLPERVAKRTEQGVTFPNIAQYFSGQQALNDLITPTETVPNMALIPSDPFLTLRDLGGSGRPEKELRFVRDIQALSSRQLASLGGAPDWIVIDTPPALSVFTRAGLAVAHTVLAPLRPRDSSLAGTEYMLGTLNTVCALTGASLPPVYAVITHWDDLKQSTGVVEVDLPRILSKVNGKICKTKVPIDNQLEILAPGAKTRGATAYEALANEM